MPPDDRAREDELFRQIVAGFDAETTDPVPRWPVSEDAERTPPEPAPEPTSEHRDEPAAQSGTPAGLPDWVEPAALPDEGHYVPPEPPRLPRPRLRTALGVMVLVLGLAGLLVPTSVFLDDSGASLLLAMLVTATGAWLLVNALSDHHDDGPDDGAVV